MIASLEKGKKNDSVFESFCELRNTPTIQFNSAPIEWKKER